MSTETVFIQFTDSPDRSYEIVIKPDAFSEMADIFHKRISTSHVVIVTDEMVGKLYLDRMVESVKGAVPRVDSLVLASGEETKSIAHCAGIWNQLLALGTDRKSTLIALGGGVIGDLAGFVAATFARGLNLIQFPTTLLAQVDSSVGGKVGINLPQAKNIVGVFWQPRQVLIDPTVLRTLDERNFLSGMAEVIKYGVIMDRPLFEYLEEHVDLIIRREAAILTKIIAWCCRCKAKIVQQDERELTGVRAILNYGHTLGHAIESVCGYGTVLHGEAVSIGMHFAGRLANEVGIFRLEEWRRQAKLLQAFDLPIQVPTTQAKALLEAMRRDKKVASGILNLVLPKQIGSALLTPAPSDELMLSIIQELSRR